MEPEILLPHLQGPGYTFICNNFCKAEVSSTNYIYDNFLFILLLCSLMMVTKL